jgi:hypothetical protein
MYLMATTNEYESEDGVAACLMGVCVCCVVDERPFRRLFLIGSIQEPKLFFNQFFELEAKSGL